MTEEMGPERWANKITLMLNAVQGLDRFPVDVDRLAVEYSNKVFPDDPITKIVPRDFPDFDGMLRKGKGQREGWRIGYSTRMTSRGRIRFTAAHEFGHYLVHRLKYPKGVSCTPEDLAIWDSAYNKVEAEANLFAASLLMPLDAFRRAIPDSMDATFSDLNEVAQKFGVSLTAATLRWLGYTQKRALLVVSKDDFILWSKPSKPALRSGAFIRTAGLSPKAVPFESPIRCNPNYADIDDPVRHRPGIWLNEEVLEYPLVIDQYELGMSLLLLQNASPVAEIDEEPVEDAFDHFMKPNQR